jgi:hypothetical protein
VNVLKLAQFLFGATNFPLNLPTAKGTLGAASATWMRRAHGLARCEKHSSRTRSPQGKLRHVSDIFEARYAPRKKVVVDNLF